MKLWLLRPQEKFRDAGDRESGNPWAPWYDKFFGFVVRAENEQIARGLAHLEAGAENHEKTAATNTPWLDSDYSTCVELTPDGPEEVVIHDFEAA